MKRGRSPETDEDSYDEQEFQKDGCPSQSYHISDRKKRRGVIEKRRRDRINNSLCELRRLVPAAFEKQGSAKLEKAEILQMTVDHLKLLHSRGLGGYNVEAASIALDCRMTGFRECAAEVARYLVSVEGLELQDPLRLRLIGHLQCYCAQRESAAVAKAPTTHPPPPWNHVTRPPNFVGGHHYGPSAPGPPARTQHGAAVAMMQHDQPMSSSSSGYVIVDQAARLHHVEGPVAPASGHVHGRLSSGAQMPGSASDAMMSGLPAVHSQFFGVNSMAMLSPNGLQYHHSASSISSSSSNLLGQSVKPYRPWGAELVY